MRPIILGFGLLRLGAALAAIAPSGAALAIDDAGRAALRDVIEHQLDAFKRDDGAAAFADANPGIQGMMGSQERFMALVREQYKPVYRQRRHDFGPLREEGGTVEQVVRIQDEAGIDWDAIYSLEQQPDGTWKISGCRLVKAPGESA